jgi:hypothetical protein
VRSTCRISMSGLSSSSSQCRPSTRYDCNRLLQEVSTMDASLSGTHASDSHPKVKVFVLGDLLLMVAFTPRCCFVQEFLGDKPGAPMELCQFHQEKSTHKEFITCLTIVSLQDEYLLLDDEMPSFPIDIEKSDEFYATDTPSPYKSLLRGTMAGKPQCYNRVAIVIGSSSSRVYTVELRVDVFESRIVRDDIPFITCEVLPADPQQTFEHLESYHRTPFHPSGGAVSLETFINNQQETFVWITYGDGCLIRIHSAALFPSIWQKGAFTGQSVDEMIGKPAVLRCQVQLPRLVDSELRMIFPLPRAFPSLVHIFIQPWKAGYRSSMRTDGDSLGVGDDETSPRLTPSDQEDEHEVVQAIVFSTHPTAPTISFYTSEQQFASVGSDVPSHALLAAENDLVGAIVGGTKALVGGMVGATLGMFRFGSRADATEAEDHRSSSFEAADISMDVSMDAASSVSPFPSLWNKPIRLFAADEIHDAPRKLEACLIEPNGSLAAVIDNLGGILLIDLATKQIVRTFKGYRDASVHWLHSERCDATVDASHRRLNLVIHPRQRGTLEIYRMPNGSPIRLVQTDDATEIVSYSSSMLASVLLLRSRIPGASYMEEIRVEHSESSTKRTVVSEHLSKSRNPSRRSVALQLQHLRQLLSTEKVNFTVEDVINAMKAITSISDLSTALDLLSVSAVLDVKLGVHGSSFHKVAVEHCRLALLEACNGNQALTFSPVATDLSSKIQYHSQVSNRSFAAFPDSDTTDHSLRSTSSSKLTTFYLSSKAPRFRHTSLLRLKS